MRFEVLGRLAVTGTGGEITVRGRRRRLLLASLIARAGQSVPVDTLAETMWDGTPPESPDKMVQWHIHQLRKNLGEPDRITRDTNGYRLHAEPDEIDALRFERDLAAATADTDPTRAARLLDRAGRQWRGPAFEGLADRGPIRDAANRLDGLRLDATERHLELRLAAGEHTAVVAELATLAERHPFREGFTAGLMLALYRGGRQADALETFRRTRTRLADELGLEPGQRLRDLERAILTGDPALDPAPAEPAPAPVSVPSELPSARASFTGREAELDRLRELLGPGDSGPPTVAVNGIGGMGKSTLAIEVAHAVGDRFPDGRLYVDLHGATPDVKPRDPGEVLARFLRSLGDKASAEITDVDELAARFRTATADRRILVVLDDARDATQVRPILPGGTGCATIITSRVRLTTVDGIRHLSLTGLPDPAAERLLRRVLGDDRVDADPDATATLLRYCAGLPLALTICAARLVARPTWTVGSMVRRLSRERRRLSELAIDDVAVRAGFEVSYRDLIQQPDGFAAARLFRLLGLHDGPDIGLPAAAALAGADLDDTEDLLDVLGRSRLVVEHAPGRYRSHDLLRWYARELVETEEPEADRRAAFTRLLHHYCATARECCRQVFPSMRTPFGTGPELADVDTPPLDDRSAAIEWLGAEIENVIETCAACPPGPELPGAVVSIGQALVPATDIHISHDGALRLAQTVAAVSERDGDSGLRGIAFGLVGTCLEHLDRPVEAGEWLDKSLRAKLETGPDAKVSGVLSTLAEINRQLGNVDAACHYGLRGVDAGRAEGSLVNESRALLVCGKAHAAAGELDSALEYHHRAVQVAESGGVSLIEVTSMSLIGDLYRSLGRVDEAITQFDRAIARARQEDLAGTSIMAVLTWGLADAWHAHGDPERARRHWDEAIAILCDLDVLDAPTADRLRTQTPPDKPEVLT